MLENSVALGDDRSIRLTERYISPLTAWQMLDAETKRDYWLDELDSDWPEDPDKSWGEAIMECDPVDFPRMRQQMKAGIVHHIYDNSDRNLGLFNRLMNQAFGTENVAWLLDQ